MAQRGRKSAAALAVVPNLTDQPRLHPPAQMTAAARAVWLEVVNSRPADWFGMEQMALLESYCRHVVYSRVLAREIDGSDPGWLKDPDGLDRQKKLLDMHEKETRAASSLATRLRLTNQSLTDSRVAGRARDAFKTGKKPWQTLEAEE